MYSYSEISERLVKIRELIPEGVELVAVSKFHPVEAISAAYDSGQRIFGESRVQELLAKIPILPENIAWHFIGHLQTNKVKALIGKTSLIESVDSLKLIREIDLESRKKDVETRILLQVHVAQEVTKYGFTPNEIIDFFREGRNKELTNTKICGLMAMATNTDDEIVIRGDFNKVGTLYRHITEEICPGLKEKGFEIISMGMSDDWPIAVEEGANLIRIGSAIFGSRY